MVNIHLVSCVQSASFELCAPIHCPKHTQAHTHRVCTCLWIPNDLRQQYPLFLSWTLERTHKHASPNRVGFIVRVSRFTFHALASATRWGGRVGWVAGGFGIMRYACTETDTTRIHTSGVLNWWPLHKTEWCGLPIPRLPTSMQEVDMKKNNTRYSDFQQLQKTIRKSAQLIYSYRIYRLYA